MSYSTDLDDAMKRNQRQRRCDACHEVKPWYEYSSSDSTCITCKQVMFGQGLQALQTYITHETKGENNEHGI